MTHVSFATVRMVDRLCKETTLVEFVVLSSNGSGKILLFFLDLRIFISEV